MAPQTQKALVVETESAPWQFRTDWPVPKPGPGEVLVKMVSAALNPVDWIVQKLAPPFAKHSFVGGDNGAGFVEELHCVRWDGEAVADVGIVLEDL